MAAELTTAPALSTPADHLFENVEPEIPTAENETGARKPLPDDEFRESYEIARTARDIQDGGWRRIALQFPDSMLGDAPRVVQALSEELDSLDRSSPPSFPVAADPALLHATDYTNTNTNAAEARSTDAPEKKKNAANGSKTQTQTQTPTPSRRLYILADTSYSACCVDEIAAEHANADVVVHYGRACLSPTSRLPAVYVFTKRELHHAAVADAFARDFPDGRAAAKVVLMADVGYQDHVAPVVARLRNTDGGYDQLLSTEIVHNPMGRIPNRRIIDAEGKEIADDSIDLLEYSVFHISNPPTALLLALSSRVKSLHILPTPLPSTSSFSSSSSSSAQTARALLGRRYARLLSLATAGVVGILVNTLSVANYLPSIDGIRRQIAAAGKKSYTVVVGKLNPAKLANFAEIDGWVVVGCWESSLVEDDAGFFQPVITPFELSAALAGDDRRVWGGEWWGGIEAVAPSGPTTTTTTDAADASVVAGTEKEAEEATPAEVLQEIDDEESEPPVFDLRTGRLVSTSRPMRAAIGNNPDRSPPTGDAAVAAAAGSQEAQSTALSLRPKSDLATVRGVLSPGAEYLRTKRTWQGLGSDFDESVEQSTSIEEGRSGVARGYVVGDAAERR